MPEYRIVQIGSAKTGWGLEIDGRGNLTHPSPSYVAAYLEAVLRGADRMDASLIAKAICMRPDPTLAERMAHFSTTGPWHPSLNPYKQGKL